MIFGVGCRMGVFSVERCLTDSQFVWRWDMDGIVRRDCHIIVRIHWWVVQ
jgi:hypothetical protein